MGLTCVTSTGNWVKTRGYFYLDLSTNASYIDHLYGPNSTLRWVLKRSLPIINGFQQGNSLYFESEPDAAHIDGFKWPIRSHILSETKRITMFPFVLTCKIFSRDGANTEFYGKSLCEGENEHRTSRDATMLLQIRLHSCFSVFAHFWARSRI